MLIVFILWDKRLSKRFGLRHILRDLGTYKLYFFVYNLFILFFLVNKYRKYSKLVAGFTFNSFSLRLARNSRSHDGDINEDSGIKEEVICVVVRDSIDFTRVLGLVEKRADS